MGSRVTEHSIDELAARLRAWLDEDERIARLAGAGSWHVECDYTPGECPPGCKCWHRRIEGDGSPGITIYNEGGHDEDQADHITRHDPRWVLAEVSAKRALLDEALGWEHHEAGDQFYSCRARPDLPDWVESGRCDCGRDARVLAVLTHLAQPYLEEQQRA
jgi:hypothetical protein